MKALEAMKLAHAAFELHATMYPHMVKGYTIDAQNALMLAINELQELPSAAYGQCPTCGEFNESAKKLQDWRKGFEE